MKCLILIAMCTALHAVEEDEILFDVDVMKLC